MTHQGFCWLQGCELTAVMPGGSALCISKFSSFLRMFSISLPFLKNYCDHPGQKKFTEGLAALGHCASRGLTEIRGSLCLWIPFGQRQDLDVSSWNTRVFCSHVELEKRLRIIWKARFALLTHSWLHWGVISVKGVWLLLILSKSLTSASSKGSEMEQWNNVVHGFTVQRNLRVGLCYLQKHFGPLLCVRIHSWAPELCLTEVWRVQRCWVIGTTPMSRQIYRAMTAQCRKQIPRYVAEVDPSITKVILLTLF